MNCAQAALQRPMSRQGPQGPLQPRLRIGPAGGALEREADRAADAVVRGAPAPSLSAPGAPTVQRACAACQREEAEVQRSPDGRASDGARGAETAAGAVAGGGAPLAPEVRAYFEPRFGRPLDRVRVHDDAATQRAAGAIGARAFTLGHDIGFAAGEYEPHTPEGRRLLAHELAHTIQQPPFIARQAAPPFHRRRFPERGGGGTTDFEEIVQVQPAPRGGSIVGSVDRREIAPAVGGAPEEEIHSGRVSGIRFDPDCKIVVPYKIRFQPVATTTPPFCQSPPNATAVPAPTAAQVASISSQYIDALNAGLNGWYAVRVEGCTDEQPCTNAPIPIHIAAEAVTSGQDRTIDVVNRGGRGNAGTICMGSFDAGFAAHEGGHQVLALGDEYRESDPTLRARVPDWARDERVRTDLTQMGSRSSYGRFVRYNARHFRFAQVFMEAVYRGHGCTVSLVEAGSAPVDFRLDIGAGSVWGGGARFTGVTGFLGVGIPLEVQRRLMLEAGVQGQAFLSLRSLDQSAYMLGLRLGLEARTSPANFGVTGNLFGSAGVLHRPEATPYTGPILPERTSPYGELGAGIGIQSGMMGGVNLHLRAEGALGTEIANDPEALRWLRLGVTAGGSF